MSSNTIINTNVLALNSHRALKSVGNAQAKSSERLSTGMRINRASDDAAGLAISEKMRSQIRGLDKATTNSQDGISLVQTAEGAMQESQAILQRMRELTIQAGNDTLQQEDREKIQLEVKQLIEEIDSIAERTEFNKKKLLKGSSESKDGGGELEVWIQSGANEKQGLTVKFKDLSAKTLGVDKIDIAMKDAKSGKDIVDKNLSPIEKALSEISQQRATLGANQNRLEHTINSLEVASENLNAANSRIRDTDMAKEMMNLTKTNVLQQAATSMLAQANQSPQNILKLLG